MVTSAYRKRHRFTPAVCYGDVPVGSLNSVMTVYSVLMIKSVKSPEYLGYANRTVNQSTCKFLSELFQPSDAETVTVNAPHRVRGFDVEERGVNRDMWLNGAVS